MNGTGIFQPPLPKPRTLFLRPKKGIHILATIDVMTKVENLDIKIYDSVDKAFDGVWRFSKIKR